MAEINSTATTPEELAEQFPCTARPWAVWYNPAPEAVNNRPWAVNDESGEASQEFDDLATALRRAAELGKKWSDEARIQAQALAKVAGEFDPNGLTNKIQSISNGLAGVSSILERFARDGNNGLSDALDLLREQTKRYCLELGDIAADVGMVQAGAVHHA